MPGLTGIAFQCSDPMYCPTTLLTVLVYVMYNGVSLLTLGHERH